MPEYLIHKHIKYIKANLNKLNDDYNRLFIWLVKTDNEICFLHS